MTRPTKETKSFLPFPSQLFSKIKNLFLGKVKEFFPERYNRVSVPTSKIYHGMREFQNFLVKGDIVDQVLERHLNSLFSNQGYMRGVAVRPAHEAVFAEFFQRIIKSKYLGDKFEHEISQVINVRDAMRLLDQLNHQELWNKLLNTYFGTLSSDKKADFFSNFDSLQSHNQIIISDKQRLMHLAGRFHKNNQAFFQGSLTLFGFAILLGPDFKRALRYDLLQEFNATSLTSHSAADKLSETFSNPVTSPEEYYQRLVSLFSATTDKKIPMSLAYKLLLEKREGRQETAFQSRRSARGVGYYVNSCPAHLLAAKLFTSFGNWLQKPDNKEKVIKALEAKTDT